MIFSGFNRHTAAHGAYNPGETVTIIGVGIAGVIADHKCRRYRNIARRHGESVVCGDFHRVFTLHDRQSIQSITLIGSDRQRDGLACDCLGDIRSQRTAGACIQRDAIVNIAVGFTGHRSNLLGSEASLRMRRIRHADHIVGETSALVCGNDQSIEIIPKGSALRMPCTVIEENI